MLLAPVIRERKGEHVQVFEQLRAQGFVRARVDGEVVDLDAVPSLTLRQKHTIEVVVDRFRPREDIKQRLAESFETALRLGDGLVILVDMDDEKASEQLLSSRYSCPVCDYSLPELEPRLFSFNSPVGACPACDGLGVTQVFDPHRVVRASRIIAVTRRGAWLGPAQCALLPADPVAGGALRFRCRQAMARIA